MILYKGSRPSLYVGGRRMLCVEGCHCMPRLRAVPGFCTAQITAGLGGGVDVWVAWSPQGQQLHA